MHLMEKHKILHNFSGGMAVGTGGAGGAIAPPIFCQPKKFKIIKTTYRSVYRNMAKIWQ